MYENASKMRAVNILRVVLKLNETEQQGTIQTFDGDTLKMLPFHWFRGEIMKGELKPESEYLYTYGTAISGVEPDVKIVTEDNNIVLLYLIEE